MVFNEYVPPSKQTRDRKVAMFPYTSIDVQGFYNAHIAISPRKKFYDMNTVISYDNDVN